jgi:hypothetical protein
MALLSFTNLVLAGLGYMLCIFIYQVVNYRFFHPLAKFPGPFWASVTRLWLTYHNVKADEVGVIHALHKKLGKIIINLSTLLHVNIMSRACNPHHTNYAHGQ